jgi:transposase
MTAPSQRIEVITRGERRRRWSIEEKREIVAESLGPGVRPIEVIHKHGITSGQLYAWRQQLTRRVDRQSARAMVNFARVEVATEEQATRVPETPVAPVAKSQAQVAAMAAPRAKGLIEIVLPGGTSIRVDAHVDDRALRCVLGALQAR